MSAEGDDVGWWKTSYNSRGQMGFPLYGMQALLAQQIAPFRRFPPQQWPAAFNLDAVPRQIQENAGSSNRLRALDRECGPHRCGPHFGRDFTLPSKNA